MFPRMKILSSGDRLLRLLKGSGGEMLFFLLWRLYAISFKSKIDR